MEQKLTIHENQHPTSHSQSFWPASLFINPMAMDPIGWSNDLFDISHRNMSQMFDGFLGDWNTFNNQSLANVSEDEKSIRIKMEVPIGLETKDIDISTDDGVLTISASKNSHANGTDSVYSFSYSTDLPENINIDRANVSLANHKLNISIPKNAEQEKVSSSAQEQPVAVAPATSMKNDGHRKEPQHP